MFILGVIALFLFSLMFAIFGNKKTPGTDGSILIGGVSGNVETKNFKQKPLIKSGDALAFRQSNLYEIVYYAKDDSFMITILGEPPQKARDDAESAFLEALGVSRADACNLKVWVGVPINVSGRWPGQNLGLSFCAGSVGF